MKQYEQKAVLFKALSDSGRLMILDMLSCGELCACNILEKLNITQPTLSHHMKILCECGLVKCRKDGKWIWYSLHTENCEELQGILNQILSASNECICK